MIRDELNGSVILFDVNTFKNSQRLFLDLGRIQIYIYIGGNTRLNLIDFILVDDRMYIFQNFDEETKAMTQISELKNKSEGLEIDLEIFK